jgi:hypothetical protein
MVRCRPGYRLVVDSGKTKNADTKALVDKCVREKKVFNKEIKSNAFCPSVNKDLLTSKRGRAKYFGAQLMPAGISMLVDRFLSKKVKFKKVLGEGRDICITELTAKEFKELTEGKSY